MDNLATLIQPYIFDILYAILTVGIGFAVKKGYALLASFTKNKQFTVIKNFIEKAVVAAEGIYKDPSSGEKKYDFVVQAAVAFAKKEFNVTIDETQLKVLIEETVKVLINDIKAQTK